MWKSDGLEGMALRLRNNQSGLTLVELLGALVASSIILGCVTLVMVQLHTGYNKITTRESIKNEARTIVNHILQSARSGSVMAESDALALLRFVTVDHNGNPTGKQIAYTYSAATRTLTVTETDTGVTRTYNLSTRVKSIETPLSESNRKITVKVEMEMPDGSVYPLETVVYLPRL